MPDSELVERIMGRTKYLPPIVNLSPAFSKSLEVWKEVNPDRYIPVGNVGWSEKNKDRVIKSLRFHDR